MRPCYGHVYLISRDHEKAIFLLLSFQSSIGMAPYEVLYGRPFRTPLCWTKTSTSSLMGSNIEQKMTEEIILII